MELVITKPSAKLLKEVRQLMEEFWSSEEQINLLEERTEQELMEIRNTYIMTQPLPKPPYSNEVINKKNLPHQNHKNTNL